MSKLVELKNYSWRYLYTDTPALKDINITIEEGVFLGVIGPNGSGKTTFVNSVNGLIPGQYHGVKQGEVLVAGTEVEDYEKGLLQHMVGVVFSDPESQFTAMTVEDELVFGMENLGMTIPEIRERLDWVVNLVELQPLLLKPPYEISGGQKQRVALAAVLAMTPQIIILDEPTSMLDPLSRKRVFDVLLQLKKEKKMTIVVVEHSLENLIPLADRMAFFLNGELQLEEETGTFFEHIAMLMEKGIFPPDAMQFFHQLANQGLYGGKLPLTLDDASKALRDIITQQQRGAQS